MDAILVPLKSTPNRTTHAAPVATATKHVYKKFQAAAAVNSLAVARACVMARSKVRRCCRLMPLLLACSVLKERQDKVGGSAAARGLRRVNSILFSTAVSHAHLKFKEFHPIPKAKVETT